MTSGWRYSVQIPDFTKEERHGEEIVVYYQVDVLVQAPGSSEPAPPTTVWRRYSEFRQLHTNLKGAYPELFKKKELEPPSKRALRFVNNNDRLLHERRQQLEAWLWNLLSYNEIAHSRFMKLFLQLNLAVRGATATSSVRDAREDDEQLETSSELSAPSGITNLSHAMTDVLTPGTARYSTRTESLDAYRMGLRVEQRRELKHLMKIISTSLEQVSREAQEVRGENHSLLQENHSLEEQVASLNQIIKDSQYSKDERHEDLCRTIEEKESSLKKTIETVTRLENALKKSERRCEALESDVRSIKQESAVTLEKQLAEAAVLESKLQSHAVTHARLEQEMLDTKQKARHDNRLLAEAVKALRSDKAALQGKLKDREEKLKEIERLEQVNGEVESERTDLCRRLEELEKDATRKYAAFEQRIKETEDTSATEKQTLNDRHNEETAALRDVIQRLETELAATKESEETLMKEKEDTQLKLSQLEKTPRADGQAVQLVIDVKDANASSNHFMSDESSLQLQIEKLEAENNELKERVELSNVEKDELAKLKTAMKEILEENASLKKLPEANGDVPNLEGLMLTIQQLQSENQDLQENVRELGNRTDAMQLEKFSSLVNELYAQLQECSTTSVSLDGQLSPEEANSLIERVANSNGKIQLLTTQVEEIKREFPDDSIPQQLTSSITNLLSEFIQKCKEINEMKIDAFLSRSSPTPPVVSTETALKSNQSSLLKRMSTKVADSSSVPDDASQSGTPSVKMLLGGIGAKMSQGSQGFMNFMQRGAAPSDADQVSLSRRSEQQ